MLSGYFVRAYSHLYIVHWYRLHMLSGSFLACLFTSATISPSAQCTFEHNGPDGNWKFSLIVVRNKALSHWLGTFETLMVWKLTRLVGSFMYFYKQTHCAHCHAVSLGVAVSNNRYVHFCALLRSFRSECRKLWPIWLLRHTRSAKSLKKIRRWEEENDQEKNPCSFHIEPEFNFVLEPKAKKTWEG